MRIRSLEKEEAIRTVALKMIADEGLENLSMQKLAKAANISPRTIYLKYRDKDDLLIRLYIDEVLGNYEAQALLNFNPDMPFEAGVRLLWQNVFSYLIANRHAFALLQYGKSSPLLNKAFRERNIKEGDYFGAVHQFLNKNMNEGVIKKLPVDVYRLLLFSPVIELAAEYFDYQERPVQIITPEVIEECIGVLVKGVVVRDYV